MTNNERRERVRIYILYWQFPRDCLASILEERCPEKTFEIKKYSSISTFRETDERSGLKEGEVLIVHLGQDSEKEDPEILTDFVREIRLKWPFCRIGIESGAYLYSTDGERKQASVEQVLENNLPDFYFYSHYSLARDPFFIKMLLKGSLSNEEIEWRDKGNVMTSYVEIGSGGRRVERE